MIEKRVLQMFKKEIKNSFVKTVLILIIKKIKNMKNYLIASRKQENFFKYSKNVLLYNKLNLTNRNCILKCLNIIEM